MQERIWDDLINRLEDNFGEAKIHKREEAKIDDLGNQIVSKIDFVDFTTSGHKYRVEKVITPLVLDRKSHYSHTSGTHANVEYILSDTETTMKIRVYKHNEDKDDWEEIQASSLF